MNNPTLGHITLGIYALLLAVGGVIGFIKGKSKASLISGLLSAIAAIAALVLWREKNAFGWPLGMLLAVVMFILFGYRYSLRWKFMPSGMLALVSLIVLAALMITPDWSGGQ